MRSCTASLLTLRLAQYVFLSLLALALFVSPASTQAAEPAVVHAVLFISPACTFCRQTVERDLPPVTQEFGKQLQIMHVDVNSPDGKVLYEAALEAFDVPRGVPLLFIGETTLGGVNITPKLPDLVETYIAQGGTDWPAIPGLQEYLNGTSEISTSVASTPAAISSLTSQNTNNGEPVVRSLMFWMAGCTHCEAVIQDVLPPLQDKHGSQFELFMIEVVTTHDVELLYQITASYNIPKDQTGVPFLIIGEQVLIGDNEIREQLPALIDDYLAQGGVDWPSNPALKELLPTISEMPAATESTSLTDPLPLGGSTTRNNGFALAIVIMIGMGAVLLYSIAAFVFGKAFNLPDRVDWLIPVFIVIGIAVASYLSYVETQSVQAICGPVGDCNTVQQSRYARLFDFLPVGVLGLMGYIALLASWLAGRFVPRFEKPAALGFFGMAFLAVIFSLYLTYLELYVIRAVCIWCLTSAVIVTILLLLGTSPAVRQFTHSYEAE